jgi:hypothetical protein
LLQLAAAALVVVGVVAGARWILRATDPGGARALQVQADSLRRVLASREVTLDSLRAAALEAKAPHEAAKVATDSGAAALRRQIQSARDAARRDALAVADARRELEELARRAEEQLRLQAIERQAATERIRRLEVTVTYAPVVIGTARALVDVQEEQLDRERARRSWWRMVVRGVCVAGPTAGGAAAGTVAAGPGGAAVGATVGLAVGATACR